MIIRAQLPPSNGRHSRRIPAARRGLRAVHFEGHDPGGGVMTVSEKIQHVVDI